MLCPLCNSQIRTTPGGNQCQCPPSRQCVTLPIVLLTTKECLQIKRFTQIVVAQVGARARGRNHEDLLMQAASKALQESRYDTDLLTQMLFAVREVGVAWRDEIWNSLLSLNPTDLLRLGKYAELRVLAHDPPRNSEDLLHQALLLTANGQKIWDTAVPLVEHLFSAMNDISSAWWKDSLERRLREPDSSVHTKDLSDTPDNVGTKSVAKERLEQLRLSLSHDATATSILEQLENGHDKPAIMRQLQVSDVDYKAAMSRIRRALGV
jgi:hypothetical protein